MRWKYFLVSSLLFLNLLQLLQASPQSQVHRGLALKAAFMKAVEVCPGEANEKRKNIKQQIKHLEAPLHSSSDPSRNSYKASYQESPELISKYLGHICKFENTFSQIDSEGINADEGGTAEGLNSISFEAEELEESGATTGAILGSFSVSGSVIFGAGFVLGILLSFLLKNHNVQAQVSSMKVVRRPEL